MQLRSLIVSWFCWVLLSCTFLALRPAETRQILGNDSFQYLSVAQNILAGQGDSTSILFFDEQFYTGKLPAPQTVFPPAYPILVSAIAYFGMPLEQAGVAISLVSFWIILLLLLLGSRMLRLSPNVTRAVMFLCVANSGLWMFATAVVTESLFTAVALMAIIILAAAESPQSKGWLRLGLLAGGSLLAAASYWVRTAGLFVIAGIGVYFFILWCKHRDRKSLLALVIYGSVACASTLLGVMRNCAFSGTWKGGNSATSNNSFCSLAYDLCSTAVKLIVGYTWSHHMLKPLTAWTVLVFGISALVVFAAFVFAVVFFVRNRSAWLEWFKFPLTSLCVCCIAVYSAAMIYCGKYTVISFGDPRMFVPLIPMVALLVGSLLSQASWQQLSCRSLRYWKAAAVAFFVIYAASHLATQAVFFRSNRYEDEAGRIRALLQTPMQDGTSTADWIAKNIPPDEPVFATVQGVGYVLQRKTICIGAWYNQRVWDDKRVRDAMKTYGVRYMVFFPNAKEENESAEQSTFVTALHHEKFPPWTSVAARSESCIIFKLAN